MSVAVRRSAAAAALAAAVALSAAAGHSPAAAPTSAPTSAPATRPAAVMSMGFAAADDWLRVIGDMAGKETADQIRGQVQMAEVAAPWMAGLRTDRPFGAIAYAGTPLPVEASILIDMPVQAGKATLADLKAAGGQPVAGSPDILVNPATHYAMRRTADGLQLSPVQDLVTGTDPAAVAELFHHPGGADCPLGVDRPGTLMVMTMDFPTWRRADPAGLGAMMANSGKPTASDDERQMANDMVANLPAVTFAVGADATAARCSVAFPTAEPLRPPAARPRPAFPDGCIGRIDTTYATPEQAAWLTRGLDWAAATYGDQMFKSDGDKQGMAVLRRTTAELLGGTALSVAVRPTADGKYVGYAVEEFAKQPDPAGTFARLLADARKMGPTDGVVTVSAYDDPAAGGHVDRLAVADPSSHQTYCLDVNRSGRTLWMTVAADAAHHLPELVAAKPDGSTVSALCDGWVDAAALVRAYADLPDNPVLRLAPADKQQLANLFAGQRLSFDGNPVGRFVQVNVSAPRSAVRTITQLVMQSR